MEKKIKDYIKRIKLYKSKMKYATFKKPYIDAITQLQKRIEKEHNQNLKEWVKEAKK